MEPRNIGFCNNTKAFLSTSSQEIAYFNSLLSINNDFNVLTTERIEFKSNSYDLFNGVGSSSNIGKFTDWFWTGSNTSGRTDSHCSDWYSNSGSMYGNMGKYDIQSLDLEFSQTVAECNNTGHLLCICY